MEILGCRFCLFLLLTEKLQYNICLLSISFKINRQKKQEVEAFGPFYFYMLSSVSCSPFL